MRVDLYARPWHRPDFTDFKFHGYVTVLIAATPEEEKELDGLERITLPGDDWYGGEVERVITLANAGESLDLRDQYGSVFENVDGLPVMSLGDCKAIWYFSSVKELHRLIKEYPPSERS
ncbi:MAG: hypothetical protein ACE5FT_02015 [Candidatus Nanoarchaeia archaeon]